MLRSGTLRLEIDWQVCKYSDHLCTGRVIFHHLIEKYEYFIGLLQNNWFKLGLFLLTSGFACLLFSRLVDTALIHSIQTWTSLVSGE